MGQISRKNISVFAFVVLSSFWGRYFRLRRCKVIISVNMIHSIVKCFPKAFIDKQVADNA